jgi:hypothetical protein
MWDSGAGVIFNLPRLGEGVSLGGRGGSGSSSSSPLPASLPPPAIGWEGAVAAVGAEAVGALGGGQAGGGRRCAQGLPWRLGQRWPARRGWPRTPEAVSGAPEDGRSGDNEGGRRRAKRAATLEAHLTTAAAVTVEGPTTRQVRRW